MSAQKNYLQVQGIGGKYRIDQIGCFLTAFCNLFGDFGRDIDPVALNGEFVNRGIYIDVDDGIRDDLGWSSITQFDPNIVVTQSADHGKERSAGWPDSDHAIVRFYYQSVHTGQWIFHFCKVADANAHTIVDSWDGETKFSPYGEPTAWATYENHAPVQVRPPRFTVTETYDNGKQVKLNKQPTNLWGMNWAFDYMKDHPVEVHDAGEIVTIANKVHHEDGYDYYRRDGQVDGFNVLDCDDYTPPQPQLEVHDNTAAPVPETPVTEVSNPLPTESEEVPIEVKVITKPAYTPFKDGPHRMTAQISLPVQDLFDPTIKAQLVAGQAVIIAGFFDYKGHRYYRTANSVRNKLFVPIPLKAVKSQTYSDDDDQALNQILDEIKREATGNAVRAKDESIKKVGSFLGNIERRLHLKK